MEQPSKDSARPVRGGRRGWRAVVAATFGAMVLIGVALLLGPGWLLTRTVEGERRAAGLVLHRIAIDGHEIAYLDGGSGDVLIALHGFGADKDNWTHFAGFVTPRYRVIAPDLPGFGESSFVADASYRIADQAHRVAALADALGIARFHIAGNSMGGQIAGQLAVMYPERVQSLILMDCTGVRSPRTSDMENLIRRGEGNPLLVGSVEEFDLRMEYLFVRQPEIPEFVKRLLAAEARDRRSRHEIIFGQITPEVEGLEPELSHIKAPSLIVWGEQDRMRDASSVSVLRSRIAGSSVVMLPGCGHVPMSERPEETAAEVLRFLDGDAAKASETNR